MLEGADFAGALAARTLDRADTGATFVPAFDDPAIIAGQGTVGARDPDAVPDVDTIVVPVGGGGLVAASRLRRRAGGPSVEVVGAQVEGYTGMVHALGRATRPWRVDDRRRHRGRRTRATHSRDRRELVDDLARRDGAVRRNGGRARGGDREDRSSKEQAPALAAVLAETRALS